MPTKKIWIVSKSTWTASLYSSNPSGDTSWMNLSKFSGAANYPLGEYVDAIVTNNSGANKRSGGINFQSNGTVITVAISQQSTEFNNLVNAGYNLVNAGYNLIN